MKPDDSFHDRFQSDGFALLENQLITIPQEILKLTEKSPFTKIYHESDGSSPRSFYGFHQDPEFAGWLSAQSLLRDTVYSILGKDVYLHQSKVNLKNRSESSRWPYHRDFPFWNVFDHIPSNQMLNLTIFLDDVSLENGALTFIPGSHLHFLEREKDNHLTDFSLEGSASSDLLFNFSTQESEELESRFGSKPCTGPKGSLLIFNPDTIHGSLPALQDQCRKLMILTFNCCDNMPVRASLRPEFLCSTNYSPIVWT